MFNSRFLPKFPQFCNATDLTVFHESKSEHFLVVLGIYSIYGSYLNQMAVIQSSDKLFICHRRKRQRVPISTQRLAHQVMDPSRSRCIDRLNAQHLACHVCWKSFHSLKRARVRNLFAETMFFNLGCGDSRPYRIRVFSRLSQPKMLDFSASTF